MQSSNQSIDNYSEVGSGSGSVFEFLEDAMENFHSYTVKQLQAKCREIGISCTGKKGQLIDRLESHTNKDAREVPRSRGTDLTQRVLQLEELIDNMKTLTNRYRSSDFNPSAASSPQQTFLTPEESPPHSGSVSFPGVSTSSSVCSPPQTFIQHSYPFVTIDASPRSVYSHQYATAG